MFSSFTPKRGEFVLYDDNKKLRIIIYATNGNSLNPTIKDALLVEFLEHNLQSISHLCDKGNNVTFYSYVSMVIKIENN